MTALVSTKNSIIFLLKRKFCGGEWQLIGSCNSPLALRHGVRSSAPNISSSQSAMQMLAMAGCLLVGRRSQRRNVTTQSQTPFCSQTLRINWQNGTLSSMQVERALFARSLATRTYNASASIQLSLPKDSARQQLVAQRVARYLLPPRVGDANRSQLTTFKHSYCLA